MALNPFGTTTYESRDGLAAAFDAGLRRAARERRFNPLRWLKLRRYSFRG